MGLFPIRETWGIPLARGQRLLADRLFFRIGFPVRRWQNLPLIAVSAERQRVAAVGG